MKYVYVGGTPVKDVERHTFKLTTNDNLFNSFGIENGNTTVRKRTDFTMETLKQARTCLISIIGGLNQKNFGLDTLSIITKSISEFQKNFTKPSGSTLYIDSGGYSIIVGDVPPTDILKFIDCYIHYLSEERDTYDYMFSLDIPVFLAHPQYNTIKTIYDFNKISLSKSIEVFKEYPEVAEKFYFIYQFKLSGQYKIWKQLYDELELKKYISCWGIGGMVGLRGILRNDPNSIDINFSPITAMSYRSFIDYLDSDGLDKFNFKLHALGVYIKYDRFHIWLLEKLFERYRLSLGLKPELSCHLTYDSINYFRTAELKVRSLEVFEFTGDDIIIHPLLKNLDSRIYKSVYGDKYDDILKELVHLNNDENLGNVDSFVPINVFSNLQLDTFFEWTINSIGLVEDFFNCNHFEQFKLQVYPKLLNLNLRWPLIYTPKMIRCIKENLRITYIFHHWYMTSRDPIKLDHLIESFVKKIGFPGGLK